MKDPMEQSCLVPLQRVLDIQLQAARCSLGIHRRQAASLADQVKELRANEVAALADASGASGRLFAASVHQYALRHLVSLAQVRRTRTVDLRAAERKVSEGMSECVERDRKLAVVQRLHDRALQAQAALAAWRQSREADLDWLAQTQRKARR